MAFRLNLLPIFAVVFVAVAVASHAAPSSEEYWKKVLPNTPIPKTIQDSLQSEGGAGVSVGSGGVDVSAGKPGKGSTNVHVGKGKSPKAKHVSVYVKPGQPFPFIYQYAATKTQLQDNPNVALFFLEKDLTKGTQMNLHFTKSTNGAPLLPRPMAESIPFSSRKMPEILAHFDISPGSSEAKLMEETVKECEAEGIQSEEKHCSTSLESMVDYATSKLGKHVDSFSTYVEKETAQQTYTFTGVRKVSGTATMVCHKMNYAYGVFYCHKTKATSAYKVPMVGADGTKVKGAVICHTDTSNWNPKHLAFQVLKIKPGTTPICHFLPEDHIVWVSV